LPSERHCIKMQSIQRSVSQRRRKVEAVIKLLIDGYGPQLCTFSSFCHSWLIVAQIFNQHVSQSSSVRWFPSRFGPLSKWTPRSKFASEYGPGNPISTSKYGTIRVLIRSQESWTNHLA
jgi:hypothetical protein